MKQYKYIKNNNSIFRYDCCIYVSKDGNDSNDGSENSPLLTIQAALNKVKENNTLIMIGEGEFTEVSKSVPSYYGHSNSPAYKITTANLYSPIGFEVTLIGVPKKTIINMATSTSNDSGCILVEGVMKIFNCILNCEMNSSRNYYHSNSCFVGCVKNGAGMVTSDLKLYNCVINTVNNYSIRNLFAPTTSMSFRVYFYNCIIDFFNKNSANFFSSHYSATSSSGTHCKGYGYFYSCIIKNSNRLGEYYSQAPSAINFYDCFSNNVSTHGSTVSATNCIVNVPIMDSDYYIISDDGLWKYYSNNRRNPDNSNAHVGLYGGEYSWGSSITVNANVNIENYHAEIDKNTDYNFRFGIEAPYIYDISEEIEIRNVENHGDKIECRQILNKDLWKNIKNINIL